MRNYLRVKICGITKPEQGEAIAQLGATALGFICVPTSPRYVTPAQIQAVIAQLPSPVVDCIGVFADTSLAEIYQIVRATGLSGVQLHGTETPEFCRFLRQHLPEIELIKALRVKTLEALNQAEQYTPYIDTLLLDAYHPQQLGGTGQTLNWAALQQFQPVKAWFLAGGLTPDNIDVALSQVQPQGIDCSSGVERSPGDKDLDQVSRLLIRLQQLGLIYP